MGTSSDRSRAHDTPAARVGYVFRHMAAHDTPPARVGYVVRHVAAHDTPAARVGYVFRQMAAHGLPLAHTKADLNAYLHRLAAHKPLNPAA